MRLVTYGSGSSGARLGGSSTDWLSTSSASALPTVLRCRTTADEISDPHDLRLWLTKNGVMKQDSNTRHMIFDIPFLIADISSGITLEPGDIIATGTPEGVGAGLDPQEWLWPGDVVEAGVDGVGILRHPVVAI